MNWTNKYSDFRVECIIALREALKKGYNKEELWNSEKDEKYGIPTAIYYGDIGSEVHYLISWDAEEECFTGISWETSEEYHFWIDDLETRIICELIDLIN